MTDDLRFKDAVRERAMATLRLIGIDDPATADALLATFDHVYASGFRAGFDYALRPVLQTRRTITDMPPLLPEP